MEHFCANHPNVEARKKCLHCGKYICGECEIPFLERSFCSWSCLFVSLRASFVQLFKPGPKPEEKSIAGRRLKFKWPMFWGICLFLLVLGVFGFGFYTIYVDYQRSQKIKMALELIEQPFETHITGSIADQPDAMVMQNNIRITGEAADSIIVSLKVNGKLIAAKLPADGHFEFDNIELEYGSNEILVLGLDAAGHATILQKIETTYGTPRLSFLARDVVRGPLDLKQIALTFDGGAGNGATADILNILRAKGLKCTMFLTAAFIKNYPAMVKQMLKDGHEIGNHTRSHPHLTSFAENSNHTTLANVTRDMLQDELIFTAKRFHETTGKKMLPFWRAPFGEHNAEIRTWAAELGYRQIGWTHGGGENMDSMDWVADTTSSAYKTADEILLKLLHFGDGAENGANGAIILMHLDTQRQNGDQAFHIIPAFVDSMRARGYKFTTVSDLLRP